MNTSETLIITVKDIQIIIEEFGIDSIMDELIERLQSALVGYKNHYSMPARSGFHYESPENGLIEFMPIYQYGQQVTLKVVGYHPNNPDKFGIPTILSTISSYDTNTGHLNCLADGVFLTCLRTGATSAIATNLLSHPDSTILGLIGCGAQSVTQLHAISRIKKIEKVLFFDIDKTTADSFVERTKALDLDIQYHYTTIENIVNQSDIICTATSIDIGVGPLFGNLIHKNHLHINAVGSDFPDKIEVPISFLKKALVCPDFLDQAILEGECQQLTEEDIGKELSIYLKNPSLVEKYKYLPTVFDSTGMALQDQIVLQLFSEYTEKLDIGYRILIEDLKHDPKNPYDLINKKSSVLKEIII